MSSSLLAYCVRETEEHTGGIVFAKTNAQARREGAAQYSDGDFHSVECFRAKWADIYTPGPVPILALVENGWWHECTGCGRRCSYDEDDGGEPINPVEDSNGLFCTPACQVEFYREKTEIAYLSAVAIDTEKRRLSRILPGCVIAESAHVYTKVHHGVRYVHQIRLNFTFPGCAIGPASWGFNKVGEQPYASVCNGDLAAWELWRATKEIV